MNQERYPRREFLILAGGSAALVLAGCRQIGLETDGTRKSIQVARSLIEGEFWRCFGKVRQGKIDPFWAVRGNSGIGFEEMTQIMDEFRWWIQREDKLTLKNGLTAWKEKSRAAETAFVFTNPVLKIADISDQLNIETPARSRGFEGEGCFLATITLPVEHPNSPESGTKLCLTCQLGITPVFGGGGQKYLLEMRILPPPYSSLALMQRLPYDLQSWLALKEAEKKGWPIPEEMANLVGKGE